MPPSDEERLRGIVAKYRQNIERELGVEGAASEHPPEKVTSREYQQFKRAFMPHHLSLYEKACAFSEKTLQIKPDKKQLKDIEESINTAHLSVTPAGVISFSFLFPIALILFGSLLSFLLFQSMFFVMFFLITGAAIIKPLGGIPKFLANNWRLKASNQMVLCIFYLVTYMRHTPNLENAVVFAGDHLSPPLSLDLKRLMWSVETERYSTLKEAMDDYLEGWKKYNMEFVESFHLVESSLYEGDEARRLGALDKALDIILDETYEKMLHYAHNLQNPITALHMLGVIMPILGLVILPLVVSFMEGARWYHIALLYNLALPIAVYFLGRNILSKRPTGYGQTDISEDNPELKKYKKLSLNLFGNEILITPLLLSSTIAAILFIIGISPLLLHAIGFPDIGFGAEDVGSPCGRTFCLLEYKQSQSLDGVTMGPYGLGAAILSLFVPMSLAVFGGLYYKMRSKNVIKIRNRAKQLELEFASALFQLGNRLGDNMPVEIAVEKVSGVMEGTISGNFFRLAALNQRRLGMSIEQAIFDKQHGALAYFPSNMIESSMKVLIQSIKKGPRVAAQALTNVSRYIKEIHRVNERLKDIMADIISSMKSQIKFLAPAIAGVVIGITSMVTTILSKLGQQLENVTSTVSSEAGAAGGAPVGLLTVFGDGIPTFQFQIIVGLYVVQLVYILTILANGIENGSDKLSEEFLLGQNLLRSTFLYCAVSLVVMIMFNMIASSILTSTLG